MNDLINLLLLVVAAANIIAFILVGLDKRKSINSTERVPEVYFFVWSIFFSSVGVLLGMLVFRHKTRKWYFPVGIGLLLVQQVTLLYLLLNAK